MDENSFTDGLSIQSLSIQEENNYANRSLESIARQPNADVALHMEKFREKKKIDELEYFKKLLETESARLQEENRNYEKKTKELTAARNELMLENRQCSEKLTKLEQMVKHSSEKYHDLQSRYFELETESTDLRQDMRLWQEICYDMEDINHKFNRMKLKMEQLKMYELQKH